MPNPHDEAWHRAQRTIVAAEAAEVRRREREASERARIKAEQKRVAALPVLEREAIAIANAGLPWLDKARAQVAFWIHEWRVPVVWLRDWRPGTRSADRAGSPHVLFRGGVPVRLTIPVVADRCSFAVGLHELAHIATKRDWMSTAQSEVAAWNWVRQRAFTYSPGMDSALARYLGTYQYDARPSDGVALLVADAEDFGEPRRRLNAMRHDRNGCTADHRVVIPSERRFTSAPPPGRCLFCWTPSCDICRTRSAGQGTRRLSDRARDILNTVLITRPPYIGHDVDTLRLCDRCDAQPIPLTEPVRLEVQIAAQHALVKEIRQRRVRATLQRERRA